MTSRTINPLGGSGARGNGPRAEVTRKDFTDRLGLPADAPDAMVLASVGAAVARKRARSADSAGQSGEPADALYSAAWGVADARPAQASVSPAEDELYEAAWGGDPSVVADEDTYPTGGER